MELIDDSEVDYTEFKAYEPPIVINQVGYKPDSKKTAVFREVTDETEFSVIDFVTGKTVYTGELYGKTVNSSADETDYFGEWTPKKFVLINTVCGFTMSDWNSAGGTGAKIIYGRCGFFATMVQKYLQEQADAGTPVLDSDGKYMQLHPDYAVDYSRYE